MADNVREKSAELAKQLWAIANEFRGNMDASEFKNYILGLIFYRYLSERTEDYMNDLNDFFELYCNYIEGGFDEYFRYPEYKSNKYFAGNRLDIEWLSYNFSLILLKLVHYADLDNEI